MYQHFTERARRVIFYSQQEAQQLGASFVSTEHLLLGLLHEECSLAARTLDQLGVDGEQVRSEVERHVKPAAPHAAKDVPLTLRAKRVMDAAFDEAHRMSSQRVGTEHLLLGLTREGDGLAGKVLNMLGVELEQARRQVRLLQEENPRPQMPTPKFEPQAASHTPRSYGQHSWQSAGGNDALTSAQAVDAINTYVFGMNTANGPLAVSKFSYGIKVDYSAVGGDKGTVTRDELRQFLQQMLGKEDLCVHTTIEQAACYSLELSEFVAVYSTRYCIGPVESAKAFTLSGRYRFKMRGSLICDLTVEVSDMDGDPSVLAA